MKRIFLLTLAVLTAVLVWAQESTDRLDSLYYKRECYITMRDGVRLFTSIYAPRDTVKTHPILLTRTPYSCSPYGEGGFADRLTDSNVKPYVDRGYIIVCQDVRGRYMSEGEYVHVRPYIANKSDRQIDEASDAYDTVDWLIANVSRNNGRVGVIGTSYPGFYALMAGLSGHPAIRVIVPQAPVTDWFMGDDTHHNGAFELADAFSLLTWMDRPRSRPEQKQAPNPLYRKMPEYDYFLSTRTVDSLTRMLHANYPVHFWDQMMLHPDYDSWWQARNTRNACYDIRPAVLVVGGEFDAEDCYGAVNLYRAIRKQSPSADCRFVFGPWKHGGWNSSGRRLGDIRFGIESPSRTYFDSVELPFVDYYLRDAGSLESIPAAKIFLSGANRWCDFSQWPSVESRKTDIYLRENGSLSFDPSTRRHSSSSYVSDPSNPVPHTATKDRTKAYMYEDQRFAHQRADVLTFTGEALAEAVTLVGPVEVTLNVSISTTDADFVVKLIDVFPDDFAYDDLVDGLGDANSTTQMGGYELLVRGDIMRGRYRNSFSTPQAFVPRQPTEVRFVMPDIAHTFAAGHRIMIQIQSSWFPLFDCNPQQMVDIYRCKADAFVPCTVEIFHQRDLQSKISVHRIE